MGPRQLSRGIVSAVRPPRGPRATGFNGATAIEPWNLRSLQRRISAPFRFNGATAIEPWNRHPGAEGVRPGDKASMGPRQLSRGIEIPPRAARPHPGGFNGATAIEPWNQRLILLIHPRFDASMGPRQLSRGIRRRTARPRRHTSSFNGATAIEPWNLPEP